MVKFYGTIMCRWGDPQGHSYVLGFFQKKLHAQVAGKAEKINRANKYEPIILELEVKSIPIKPSKVKITTFFKEVGGDKTDISLRVEKRLPLGSKGSNYEVTEEEVLSSPGLSHKEIKNLHYYLSHFSQEEQVFFRDWYLKYINR